MALKSMERTARVTFPQNADHTDRPKDSERKSLDSHEVAAVRNHQEECGPNADRIADQASVGTEIIAPDTAQVLDVVPVALIIPVDECRSPRPLPWRPNVARWPITLRQAWGDRANALQDEGHDWHESERLAFEELKAESLSAGGWGPRPRDDVHDPDFDVATVSLTEIRASLEFHAGTNPIRSVSGIPFSRPDEAGKLAGGDW